MGPVLGSSSRPWRVPVMLNRTGLATSGRVAADTRRDHSQVSRACSELVDKGLIGGDRDQADRQRQCPSVTDTGKAVLRCGNVDSQARPARLRARLGDADCEGFGRVLAILSDQVRRMLAQARTSTARDP